MILEYIGYRTLIILGLIGSAYFVSGFKNYIDGLSLLESFSPYYVLHFHDGFRLIDNTGDALRGWAFYLQAGIANRLAALRDQYLSILNGYIRPFFTAHPFMGITIFALFGFSLTILLFTSALILIKKSAYLLALGEIFPFSKNRRRMQPVEELWTFDPRRKPSEEQLRGNARNLEKLTQRAPALSGRVPKNADATLRELAKRNKEAEYNYRNVIYLMGPIKGIKLDNQLENPLTLDTVKKISAMMGPSAEYETIPADLVVLRSKKGASRWEMEPSIAPVNLGKSFPVKIIEKIMMQQRNTFIWDQRAARSKTGYGVR